MSSSTRAPASWATRVIASTSASHAERYDDVVHHHERGLLPHDLRDLLGGQAGRRVDVDPPERQPALLGDAHRDVAVGREVVAVDDDLGASRAGGDGGAHQLVEQHGRGVADGDLAGQPRRGRRDRGRHRG